MIKLIKSFIILSKVLKACGEKKVTKKVINAFRGKEVYTRINDKALGKLKEYLAPTIFRAQIGYQRLTYDPGVDIVIFKEGQEWL